MRSKSGKYHLQVPLSPKDKERLQAVADYYGLRLTDQVRLLIRKAYREIRSEADHSSELKTAA